jgi:hypothetical protein
MSRSALLLSASVMALFVRTAQASGLLAVLVGSDHATPAVLEAMQRAAEAALAPRITLTWRTSQDLEGTAVSTDLAIIRLRGECRPRGGLQSWNPPSSTDAKPLGQTYISDGHVLPIADILCDTVWKLVGPDLRGASARERDELLGRALGRVVAHELYHITLQTTAHTQEGLTRPSLRSTDLLSEPDTPESLEQPLDSGR